jgi:hypothetical protein
VTADDWTIVLAGILTGAGAGMLIFATVAWWKWRNQ